MQVSYTSLLTMLRSSAAAWVVACTDLCISWRHVVLSRSSCSAEAALPSTRNHGFVSRSAQAATRRHNSSANAFTALILSGFGQAAAVYPHLRVEKKASFALISFAANGHPTPDSG